MQRAVADRDERDYEMSDVEKEHAFAQLEALGANPANDSVYAPDDKQRIPKAGAWVMITRRLPAIEGSLDREIRVGRIFYAVHDANADEKGFLPGGLYKVLLRSPWGDLWLWPYEYSTIDTDSIVKLWTLGEVVFHPTHVDDHQMNSVMFYARSRGIGMGDAAMMALGTITGNVGWFEPRADLVADCEDLEERVNGWWRGRIPRRVMGGLTTAMVKAGLTKKRKMKTAKE